MNEVSFETGLKTGQLHCILKKHITSLQKAKKISNACICSQAQLLDRENYHCQFCRDWPQIPSSQLKCRLVQMFKDETSLERLATFTCVCCAESVSGSKRRIMSVVSIDLSLLCRPDQQEDQHMSNDYFDGDCPVPPLPFADSNGVLHDLMLNPFGVRQCGEDDFQLSLCDVCDQKLKKGKHLASVLQIELFWETCLMN